MIRDVADELAKEKYQHEKKTLLKGENEKLA